MTLQIQIAFFGLLAILAVLYWATTHPKDRATNRKAASKYAKAIRRG